MAGPNVALVDPFALDTLSLSKAALKYVAELIPLSEISPLRPALPEDPVLTEEEREQAREELGRKGVTLTADASGIRPSATGELYRAALEVLAQPSQLFRFITVTPEAGTRVHPVFASGDTLAPAYVEGDVVKVGAAISREAMRGFLVRSLKQPPVPEESRAVELWTGQVQALMLLWEPEKPGAALGPMAEAQALQTLKKLEIPEPDAKELLANLLEVGALERKDGKLVISSALLPWLTLYWSGHWMQIEAVTLLEDPEAELEEEDWDRLTFVGPPGKRVQYETYPEGPAEAEGTEAGAGADSSGNVGEDAEDFFEGRAQDDPPSAREVPEEPDVDETASDGQPAEDLISLAFLDPEETDLAVRSVLHMLEDEEDQAELSEEDDGDLPEFDGPFDPDDDEESAA